MTTDLTLMVQQYVNEVCSNFMKGGHFLVRRLLKNNSAWWNQNIVNCDADYQENDKIMTNLQSYRYLEINHELLCRLPQRRWDVIWPCSLCFCTPIFLPFRRNCAYTSAFYQGHLAVESRSVHSHQQAKQRTFNGTEVLLSRFLKGICKRVVCFLNSF
jgi:hypothetical protein